MNKATYPEALRALAEFIEANDFPVEMFTTAGHGALGIHVNTWTTGDQKETLNNLRRALGGSWEKRPNGTDFYFKQSNTFGYFDTTIFLDRDAVCERKLVGMEDVEIPAVEAAPARTESRPIYEWECNSVLAPERDAVPA